MANAKHQSVCTICLRPLLATAGVQEPVPLAALRCGHVFCEGWCVPVAPVPPQIACASCHATAWHPHRSRVTRATQHQAMGGQPRFMPAVPSDASLCTVPCFQSDCRCVAQALPLWCTAPALTAPLPSRAALGPIPLHFSSGDCDEEAPSSAHDVTSLEGATAALAEAQASAAAYKAAAARWREEHMALQGEHERVKQDLLDASVASSSAMQALQAMEADLRRVEKREAHAAADLASAKRSMAQMQKEMTAMRLSGSIANYLSNLTPQALAAAKQAVGKVRDADRRAKVALAFVARQHEALQLSHTQLAAAEKTARSLNHNVKGLKADAASARQAASAAEGRVAALQERVAALSAQVQSQGSLLAANGITGGPTGAPHESDTEEEEASAPLPAAPRRQRVGKRGRRAFGAAGDVAPASTAVPPPASPPPASSTWTPTPSSPASVQVVSPHPPPSPVHSPAPRNVVPLSRLAALQPASSGKKPSTAAPLTGGGALERQSARAKALSAALRGAVLSPPTPPPRAPARSGSPAGSSDESWLAGVAASIPVVTDAPRSSRGVPSLRGLSGAHAADFTPRAPAPALAPRATHRKRQAKKAPHRSSAGGNKRTRAVEAQKGTLFSAFKKARQTASAPPAPVAPAPAPRKYVRGRVGMGDQDPFAPLSH